MSAGRLILLAGLATVTGLPILGVSTRRAEDTEAYWRNGWRELAAHSDDGFLVWESRRSGHWRILRRALGGGEVARISPNEAGRDHFAPHLSPDGTRVVYASIPSGTDLYEPLPDGVFAQLRIMNADGSDDRELISRARGYFEDRVAVWIDDDRLYYIDEHGATQRLTLSTMQRTEVTGPSDEPFGWLLDPTGRHATCGWPTFAPYDATNKRVLLRSRLDGCQPYFSHDGRWGYWTSGVGGPLSRFDLTTREASPIIRAFDDRLPNVRRYVYFPMLSACQTAFAFAASPFKHDHFKSDYDVFVARIDPFTLEIEGRPQRYTFDGACDRFPDVHYARLRLGKHRGTAPYELTLKAPEADARWDFGDGSAPSAGGSHTFTEPGRYWVTASTRDERWRGYVRVDAPSGPHPVVARLVSGPAIEVEFDRAIRLDRPSALLSGHPCGESFTLANPTTLRIGLARTVRSSARLAVRGVRGADAASLEVVHRELDVRLEAWPFEPDGLAFVFEHGRADNLVTDALTGQLVTFAPEMSGPVHFDRRFALEVEGGTVAFPGAAENLAALLADRGAFTLAISVELATERRDGRILALESDDGPLLEIWQREARMFAMLAPSGGERIELALFGDRDRMPDITVGVGNGQAFGRIDAVARATAEVPGDARAWRPTRLVVGDGEWHGTVHHVAVFARARSELGSTQDQRLLDEWRQRTPTVEQRRVRAELIAKSPVPTLDRISPYRDAISVFEYATADGPVRVKHRVMLDGVRLPIADRQIGQRYDLVLEPSTAHPEIEATYVEDALEERFDLEDWFGH